MGSITCNTCRKTSEADGPWNTTAYMCPDCAANKMDGDTAVTPDDRQATHDYLCGRAWARSWMTGSQGVSAAGVANMALLHSPTTTAWLRGILAAIADGE